MDLSFCQIKFFEGNSAGVDGQGPDLLGKRGQGNLHRHPHEDQQVGRISPRNIIRLFNHSLPLCLAIFPSLSLSLSLSPSLSFSLTLNPLSAVSLSLCITAFRNAE